MASPIILGASGLKKHPDPSNILRFRSNREDLPMAQLKRFTPFALAILAAIILQLIFIVMDRRDTPDRAVIEFSKAYFMLSPSMTERLCTDLQRIGDMDTVGYYRYLVAEEAEERGFRLNFMKTKLYDIKTKTLKMDDTSAEVQLSGKRRFAMNPLYAMVAQLFGFSKPQRVEEIIRVKNENGRWKVCGQPFDLPTKIGPDERPRAAEWFGKG
jgi:hypothetical protein